MSVKVEVGDRVMHRGTRMWATVLEVKPQCDGTSELLVQRDAPFFPDWPNNPTWWATYHINWGETLAARL